MCFGVADGVADWWTRGVDAGAFSRCVQNSCFYSSRSCPKIFLPIRELMEQADVAFQEAPFLPPRDLMAIAHEQVLKVITHASP